MGAFISNYAYDALNRMISAEYSNGTAFGYTYDAAGNVLTYAETHYGQTTVTTYTYDAANQLLSAVEDETVWQYLYDGNGSLIQSNPGAEVANGSTRYTYNTAGYLTKVENYTTEWQTQSEMTYDGLGNRLEVTTYSDGEGNTTRYVLDGGAELTAIGAENTTYFLYGLGVIGTLGESWSYILSDGAGSTRQLVDEEGVVNLSVSYTPWGDTMEIYGSGMLSLGYLGGVYDAGTGLIYMGNGQYYDPSTGRFLTRGMNEASTNPYTPWSSDPAGMLIGPFGLIALLFAKKKKHTKLDAFIVVLILFVLMGFGSSISMLVQAASVADTSLSSMPTAPRSYAMQAESGTVGAMYAANPGAPADIVVPDEDCVIKPSPLDYQKVWDFLGGMIFQFIDDYTLGYYSDVDGIYQQLRFIIAYKLGIQIDIPTTPIRSEAFIEGQKFGRALSEVCAQADLAMALGSWANGIKIGTKALAGVVVTGGSGSAIAAPALAISVGLLLLGTFGLVHGTAMSHYIDHSPIDSGGGGGGKSTDLLDELASSGVKYNPDEVIKVFKNSDGKLMWLETGTSEAGLTHILQRHIKDFAGKGINGVDEIVQLLDDVLKTTPISKGSNAKGLHADYLFGGNTYRVAYGRNGYIVSFYPIK